MIVPENASWKYTDDGIDHGKEWKEIAFDDHNWKSGRAKLGYGGDGEQTVLTYGDDDTNKYITHYFRHKFNYNDESKPNILSANLIRDDGAVVYLNGEEIIRSNMPKGEITHVTLASGHASGASESLPSTYTIDSNLLKEGENLIAAEVHQDNITSSDIGFHSLEEYKNNIENYLSNLLKDGLDNNLLKECFNYLTLTEKERAINAFNFALKEDIDVNSESIDIETLRMTLMILGKSENSITLMQLVRLKLLI